MPFGAELTEDGQVRFRLWAPKAKRVDVSLAEGTQLLPMIALEGGWYELVTRHALLVVDTRGVYRAPRPNVVKA